MANEQDKGGISEGDFAGTRKGKKGRDPMDMLKGMFARKPAPKAGPKSQKEVASSARSLGYSMNKDGSFTKAGAAKAKSGKMKTTAKAPAKKKGK